MEPLKHFQALPGDNVEATDPSKMVVKCFFDISIGGKKAGRMVFEPLRRCARLANEIFNPGYAFFYLPQLFDEVVPKTVENFRAICTGDKGFSYKGTKIFRIIPGFMAQGGDVVNNNGTGLKSIYGEKFADENFNVKHVAYSLTMASAGPNTNNSQFCIIFIKAQWLDNRQVAFGKVVEGLPVLLEIQKLGSADGTPSAEVVVDDCGQL